MHKKNFGRLCAVLKGLLFIGFSIQIVLGAVWMCCNFGTVQDFGEPGSVVYQTFFAMIGERAGLMYVLQLLLAYYAGKRFLETLHPAGVFWGIWSILALLSFPMALQCHMAILPWSAVGSLFLLEWSFAVELLRKGGLWDNRKFVYMLLCWLGLAVLLPEYRLLGGIPVLLAIAFGWKRLIGQGRLLHSLLLAVLCGGLAFAVGTAAGKASGIEERSFSFALLHRTAWPFILQDSGGWPEEVVKVLGDQDSIREYGFSTDNMDLLMKPLMEKAFGKERADAFYREMAMNSWKNRASVILTYIRWDVIGYSASPLILPGELEGQYFDSCSGRNYEVMRNEAPLLTRHYVDYSCWWFAVCVFFAFLLTVFVCLRRGGFVWRNFRAGLFVCIFSAGALVAWYTLQGSGMMDYKASFVVSSMWLIWALAAMREEKVSGEE